MARRTGEIAGWFWDSPLNLHVFQVLSKYLVNKGSDFISGRIVLELGSGTGLVGLVAGKLGGKVQITDQAFVLFLFCWLPVTTVHRNEDTLWTGHYSTSCAGM